MGGPSEDVRTNNLPEGILNPRDEVFVRMFRATCTVRDVVYVNPDLFNTGYFKEHSTPDPADVALMRQVIDSQLPGRSANISDERIARFVQHSLTDGPSARRYDFSETEAESAPFVMLNLQGSQFDDRDEYMPTVAGRPPENLRPIPGDDMYWDGFWGVHEGTHPNQHSLPQTTSEEELNTAIMDQELGADRAGIEWLRSQGQEEMVQALIDYRALAAMADPEHSATAILARHPDQQVTREHFQAASSFASVMDQALSRTLGMSDAAVADMRKNNETGYARHVRQLFDQGQFDHASPNPYVRDFIEAYVGAVERRVVDHTADRELNTGPAGRETHDSQDTPISFPATAGGKEFTVVVGEGDEGFMRAAREVSEVPLVFLDPDAFNREYFETNHHADPEDIPIMRAMINAQVPGAAGPRVSDSDLGALVGRVLTEGPYGQRMEIPADESIPGSQPTPFGVINLPGELNDDAIHEYMPSVAHMPAAMLRSIPGTEEAWDEFFGRHEGTHPNQFVYNADITDPHTAVEIMRRELESDQAGLHWLRSQGHDDMAQTIIDYRALSASADPHHAALAIMSDQTDTPVTQENFDAARGFVGVMYDAVEHEAGLNFIQSRHLFRQNPIEFNRHIKTMLEEGAFDHLQNPYVRSYIEAWSGAVDRQVIGPNPNMPEVAPAPISSDPVDADGKPIKEQPDPVADPQIRGDAGGTPIITLRDGDQATLRIGGGTAAEFFASHADPALAEQRLAVTRDAETTEARQNFETASAGPGVTRKV